MIFISTSVLLVFVKSIVITDPSYEQNLSIALFISFSDIKYIKLCFSLYFLRGVSVFVTKYCISCSFNAVSAADSPDANVFDCPLSRPP